jgi:hypothetical protein
MVSASYGNYEERKAQKISTVSNYSVFDEEEFKEPGTEPDPEAEINKEINSRRFSV